jgi:hypothetical protein
MNTITTYKDNIKMSFNKPVRQGMKWTDLTQDRYKLTALEKRVMNVRVS